MICLPRVRSEFRSSYAHAFVGSKAPWFTITDDLPQYAAHAEATASAGGQAS